MDDRDLVLQAQQPFDDAELRDDRPVLEELLHDDISTRVSQTWVRERDNWLLAGIQFSPLADA
ncbi:hypothetical protein [Acrocarpospora catenulata]|uniref:hypothetical protein n=1 Tax=Acrocarpospora catenulata TaxID=2836182 RepID=UPI001BDB0B6E|nr:hypothetical protein [Acrocarpospora catenulata]